ncbi:hypothetical protein Tco_1427848 [Tanacetum coccineum]
MTSFDYRLNPIYAIKECSSCGSLYTSNCGCSKGSLEDKILVPKPPRNCARCAKCGIPVDGPYCQGCALLRKEFMEGLLTNCVENEFFKDFQDTSESSDDNTNVVNAPREPIVVNQDPDIQKEGRKKERIAEEHRLTDRAWMIPFATMMTKTITIAITPVLRSRKTPINSLSMAGRAIYDLSGNGIGRSKKVLVLRYLYPIPTESRAVYSQLIVVNSDDDNSSSDDDSYENIDYVDASPPDVEIVSLEVVEIVDPEVGRIDDDILLTSR